MSDTTLCDLRRLNRLYHASSRVSQAMARAAASGEEVAVELCRRLVGEGGFLVAWIGRPSGSGGALEPIGWAGPNDPSLIESLAKSVPVGVKTVVWDDFGAADSPAHQAGIAAAAAFPLLASTGLAGILCLYSSETAFFGGKELSVLEDVAESIAFGLEHIEREARQNAELATERSLLRALMDNPWNLIYFKDLESRFIRASRGLYERFGATAESIIGKSDFDYFRDEHARDAYNDEQKIIRTGEAMVGKIEKEAWKDRPDSWCMTVKLPLRDEGGKIIGTVGISQDFTAVKEAEAKLAEMHEQLLQASRVAGMAEVATSILHNVGNVLNSVNVSCAVVCDRIRDSRTVNVAKVASLFTDQAGDLASFLDTPKGRQLPAYLSDLAAHLATERDDVLRELGSLTSNIEHIKEIVAAQQNYARTAGVLESIHLPDLVDDALEMHKGAMGRHCVHVIREYSDTPPVTVDKHKVLQILINLLHNSKYAVDEGAPPEKRVVVRVEKRLNDGVRVCIIDNGIGIARENLSRIFEHGFTTRKEGHGFGLHSGALTAKELGGALTAHSAGLGQGAEFVLELPVQPPNLIL